MTIEQTLTIGTDVAAFFLFHPDDLKHRADAPLDWYGYDFACRAEFLAGNLVAFGTGGDGGYQLRITEDGLTDVENSLKNGAWTWGYTVRHGRILVDNGDFLPSEEARSIDKAPRDQWVEIPNGDYRVTVFPIARTDDSLSDYVVYFERVPAPLHIAASPTPPDLIPRAGETPRAAPGISADAMPGNSADDKPLRERYPLLIAPEQYVLPGADASVPVSDAVFEAVSDNDETLLNEDGDIYLVFAPTDAIPGLATLAWVHGSSQFAGEPGRIRLRGERLVRVTAQESGTLLPMARVEPVTRKEGSLSDSDIAALQTAFATYADNHHEGKNAMRVSRFERDRIAAIHSGEALTTRLVQLVSMPVETRFRLQAASDTERAHELLSILKSA